MNQQQKNIAKTVIIIVVIMMTFLAMFLHKMTTPRYLSHIELKVNGLVLFKAPDKSVEFEHNNWVVLVNSAEEKRAMAVLYDSLKEKLKKRLVIVERSTFDRLSKHSITLTAATMPIFDATGLYRGYFVAPYDMNKMKLTLSSVITHR